MLSDRAARSEAAVVERLALYVSVLLLSVVCFFAPGRAEDSSSSIEVFTREGCVRCASARQFLESLQRERPELQVVWRRVDESEVDMTQLTELARRHRTLVAVPSFLVRGRLIVGFDGAETTGRQLIAVLDGQEISAEEGAACSALSQGADCPAERSVDTKVFGPLRASELGLPLFTLALGLVDGFNPCAMWVLLFLLSMLVNVRDRRKMAVIAGTFVLVSGAAYFAFMAAWLNAFLLIEMSRAAELVLGGVALLVGAFNVKDFFAFKQGPSLSIPARARPTIYARTRAIVRAESLGMAVLGAAALAAIVNLVELLCTAGVPAVYTAILSSYPLSAPARYGYLALYNLAYIADDSAMVSLAVFTLSKRKLTERAGRWLKLVSGATMLTLATGLLFFPRLLR